MKKMGATNDEPMKETSIDTCKNIFKDILNDTSQYFHKVSSQRMDYAKQDHKCFKALAKDDPEVTSLTYD